MIKQVKADPRFSGGPIKVAVLTELSPSLDWSNVVDVVVAQLNPFNGGSASDPVNKNNFLQVAYDVTNPQSQAEAAAALVGLAPQIIFTIGGEGELELVAPFVEANWPAGVMPPRYIGGEPQMGYSQLGFFQGNVELMNRISTIRVQNGAFYRNDLLGGGLGSRYKAMFPQALWLGALGGDSTAQAYDLFYATMYAIVAAGAPLDSDRSPLRSRHRRRSTETEAGDASSLGGPREPAHDVGRPGARPRQPVWPREPPLLRSHDRFRPPDDCAIFVLAQPGTAQRIGHLVVGEHAQHIRSGQCENRVRGRRGSVTNKSGASHVSVLRAQYPDHNCLDTSAHSAYQLICRLRRQYD